MSRPSRSRRSRGANPLNWLPLVAGILIIGGIVGVGIALNANQRATEPTSGCPTDHYDSVTAVLVDLTDSINPVQSAAFRNALEKVRNAVPRYGRLEVYTLGPTTTATLPLVFAACSPGSGKDVASRWYGNPELADRIWRKQFGDRMTELIGKLQTLPPQSRSPILEAIQSVAVTSFGTPMAEQAPEKRLVILSDMIHYTADLSMYRGAPDFDRFKSSAYYLRVKPDLRGANVDVYLIVRATQRDVQQPPLYKFWTDYIDAANGYLRGWEPLQ